MKKSILAILLISGMALTGCSGNEYNGIKYSLSDKNTLIKSDDLYLHLYKDNDELMKFLVEKDLLPKTQTELRISGPDNKVVIRVCKGLVNNELVYNVFNPQLAKNSMDETLKDTFYKVNNYNIEKVELETIELYGFDGDEDGKFDNTLYDIKPIRENISEIENEEIEEEVVEIDKLDTLKRTVNSIIRKELSDQVKNTILSSITVNENLGTNSENDVVVLANLSWSVKNREETTREMLEMYSDHLAVKIASELEDGSEIALFWKATYTGLDIKHSYYVEGGNAYKQ